LNTGATTPGGLAGTTGTSLAPVSTQAGSAASTTAGTGSGTVGVAGQSVPVAGSRSMSSSAGPAGSAAASTDAGVSKAADGGGMAAGTAGSSTVAATGGSSAPAEVKGCGDTKLYATPDDPGAPGPWPVGAKTVHLMTSGGQETVEIWYPAPIGSETGKMTASYDLSLNLPPSDRSKIPAEQNTPQPCNCYRDLPIDTAHGPYPGVIFVHGLASFRTGSLTTMTQWASRGFIVAAADHLGEYLLDFTAGLCGGGGSGAAGNFNGDVDAELAALTKKSGDFAFLGDSIDMTRVAIGGHSMGAGTVATASTKPNVQVIILLAELGGAPVSSSSTLKASLVMGGMVDTVTQWSADLSAYSGSPMPKRLVGITGGDHLDVTDICSQTNAAGETSIDVGVKNNVCALGIVNGLAHCGNMKDPKQGPAIVNYVSTAVLETTLHCIDRSAALVDATVMGKFPAIGAYQHSP
jgi:predicted dienelactone hydrolase